MAKRVYIGAETVQADEFFEVTSAGSAPSGEDGTGPYDSLVVYFTVGHNSTYPLDTLSFSDSAHPAVATVGMYTTIDFVGQTYRVKVERMQGDASVPYVIAFLKLDNGEFPDASATEADLARYKGMYNGRLVGKARRVKSMYIGVPTQVPVYEPKTVNITASNISGYFNVWNKDDYYFAGSGSVFTSNNKGVSNSTAHTALTAKYDMNVSFTYSYSSERDFDKYQIKFARVFAEEGASGPTTTKTFSGSLKAGEEIDFRYQKDGSGNTNDDKCTFSTIVCVAQIPTGTTTKELAHKIKRAYIGIGGVAKMCYGHYDISYIGEITPLSSNRSEVTAVSVGDYALMAGGRTTSSTSGTNCTDVVDTYNKSLTRGSATYLYADTMSGLGASINGYAIISSGNTLKPTVYNASLTRSTSTDFSTTKTRPSWNVASLGNYAFFGGYKLSSSSNIDIYDTALTQTRVTFPNLYQYGAAATDDYVLFAGGYDSSFSQSTDFVAAWNRSFTQTNVTRLSSQRGLASGAKAGKYAIFAGGIVYQSDVAPEYTVEAYDNSLTKTSAPNMTRKGHNYQSISLDEYAILGPHSWDGLPSSVGLDAYDASLVKSYAGYVPYYDYVGIATVGNYAIFGGGSKSLTWYNIAYALKLV